MVQLRTYTKEGVLTASAAAPTGVNNGQLAWLGDDHYLQCDITRIRSFTWDGKSGGNVEVIATPGGTVVKAKGVAVPMVLNDDGEFIPDAHRIYVTASYQAGAFYYVLLTYSIEAGSGTLFSSLLSLASGFGGITTNGNQWYVSYTDAAPNTKFSWLTIDGKTVNSSRLLGSQPLRTDMCHDGMYLWAIESGVVKRYMIDGRKLPQLVDSFTPAGTTPLGITTNGHSLLILSRT